MPAYTDLRQNLKGREPVKCTEANAIEPLWCLECGKAQSSIQPSLFLFSSLQKRQGMIAESQG